MCERWWSGTECRYQWSRTAMFDSPLDSRQSFIRIWVLNCFPAQLTTPRLSRVCARSRRLRICYLPLAEFSYNNSYHASIDRSPFEMLYGWRCRTPVGWREVGHQFMGSTEVVLKTTELIQQVRDRQRVAYSRQKSYVDWRCSDLEFQVGDFVLLKVLP